MSDILTAKQEAFCLKFIECRNQSEAYRHAYDVGENTKPETVWVKASELMASGKVAARVVSLQQEASERTLVTVESLTKELVESRDIALSKEDVGEMTKATMAKAKLHGLDVHKVDAVVSVSAESPSDKLKGLLDVISKRGGKNGSASE